MIIYAPAKINLRLKVEGRRPDGYHLLSMLNVPIDLRDELRIELTANEAFELTVLPEDISPLVCSPTKAQAICEILGDPKENLIAKAYTKFCKHYRVSQGLKIHLKKNIPMGAGLGGGSSDAAAMLLALAKIVEGKLKIPNKEFIVDLHKIALELGADVPFFLLQSPAYVHGIGEKLDPLDGKIFSEFSFVLIIPEGQLSTKDVFLKLSEMQTDYSSDIILPRVLTKLRQREAKPLEDYKKILDLIGNDLEAPACELSELVEDVIRRLRLNSGLKVSLSGSGSAVFVLSKEMQATAAELHDLVCASLKGLPVQVLTSLPF